MSSIAAAAAAARTRPDVTSRIEITTTVMDVDDRATIHGPRSRSTRSKIASTSETTRLTRSPRR
ncbi:hypothetical protein [Aeromicrobium sp. UC242_57]|uniref:hypothetical protein n=1 Tax=Aeromicrobium sp. UC242_57 TaxID=3374624 RepID=UPI0037B61BC1